MSEIQGHSSGDEAVSGERACAYRVLRYTPKLVAAFTRAQRETDEKTRK